MRFPATARVTERGGLAPAEGERVPFLCDARTPCGVPDAYPAVTWKMADQLR